MRKITLIIVSVFLFAAAGTAVAHDVSVAAPGLDGTNYKLKMDYLAGDSSLAYVLDSTPDNETVYRVEFMFNGDNADINTWPNPAFVYFFQAYGGGFYSGNPGPVIRAGIHHVNGSYGIRVFAYDNQGNRRGTLPSAIIPMDQDVKIQIEWEAQNGSPPDNLVVRTFVSGVMTRECWVEGSLQNGSTYITDQSLITLPDGGTTITSDATLYADEFASYRTLAP